MIQVDDLRKYSAELLKLIELNFGEGFFPPQSLKKKSHMCGSQSSFLSVEQFVRVGQEEKGGSPIQGARNPRELSERIGEFPTRKETFPSSLLSLKFFLSRSIGRRLGGGGRKKACAYVWGQGVR